MSTFDDRERAQEAKYALDQETQFKVAARRNKLLGLWAADLMGMTGDDAQAYAKTVVLSDLEEVGEEDVFRKVRGADPERYQGIGWARVLFGIGVGQSVPFGRRWPGLTLVARTRLSCRRASICDVLKAVVMQESGSPLSAAMMTAMPACPPYQSQR